jgi:hypothetical protein
MQQLECLRRPRAVTRMGKGADGCGASCPADEARACGNDVGSAHGAKIGDQPIKRGIGDRYAVDVDHRIDESCFGQQGRQRGRFDARMNVGRGRSCQGVGRAHRGS